MATNPNIAMSYRPNVALQRRDPLADAASIQSLQANQTKMDDLREFKELSAKLAAAGKNPDPLAMVSEMRASGRPDMIAKSYELEANIKALGLEEKAYKALIGGAAPAGPSMMQTPQAASPTNALGLGTFGMGQANAPAPVNALAPAPAMAPQTQEINRLMQVAMQYPNTKVGAQAMKSAEIMQKMQPAQAKLSDRYVPVGDSVFDRETQKYIPKPGGGGGVASKDRFMSAGGGVFDRTTQQFIKPPAAEGGAPTKLRPGEIYNAERDRVEAKPGSELYNKQAKSHATDYKAATGTQTKMDESIAKIDNILSDANKGAFSGNFGGYNAYASRMLPGENSDLRKTIDSFKSDLKMAGLELIRQGGSIGQMTEREWPIVEQMIASIDPVLGEERARQVFDDIKTRFLNIKAAAQDVYDTQWGETQYHKGLRTAGGGLNRPQNAATPYSNLSDEDLLKQLNGGN